MTIHLDTNFLVDFGDPASPAGRKALSWLGKGWQLRACSIAWCEYLCGPVDGEDVRAVRRVIGLPLPFTEADADMAARLFNLGGRRRTSLADCQIAAIAMREQVALATQDRPGFARFVTAGLQLAPV